MIVEILSTLEYNNETNDCVGFIFSQEISVYANADIPESKRKKIIVTTPKFAQYNSVVTLNLIRDLLREASRSNNNPNSIVSFQIIFDNTSNERKNFYAFNSIDYLKKLEYLFSIVTATNTKHGFSYIGEISLSPKVKERIREHNQINVFDKLSGIKSTRNTYSIIRDNGRYIFVINLLESFSGSSHTARRFNTIVFNTSQEYDTFLLYLFTFLENGKFDFICDDKINSSDKVRIPYYDLFLVCNFLKFIKTTPLNMKQELIIISK